MSQLIVDQTRKITPFSPHSNLPLLEFQSLKTARGYTPPTLEGVLQWLNSTEAQHLFFIIDFKITDPETAKELIQAVESQGLLNRAVFESPSPKVAGMIEKLRPEIVTAIYPKNMLLMRHYLKKYHIDIASYYYPVANPLSIWLIHRKGKKVLIWTINSPGKAIWFAQMNVDGMMTDNPKIFLPDKK